MNQPRVTGVPPRYATAADWAASPLILRQGEEGIAWDTGVRKYGDGLHRWPDLPTPATSAVDLAPIEREVTAALTAATNARQMVLARDARLAAVEDIADDLPEVLAESESVHADLYARLAAVAAQPIPDGPDPDLPDPTVMFENGLV